MKTQKLATQKGEILTFPVQYFIVDDVLDNGREGFEVLCGDACKAQGVQCGQFRTLREALQYVEQHTTPDERIFRVKVARRHGVFSCAVLKGFDSVPFKEHGFWQARGFNSHGLHFNRAFKTKRECEKFLRAMKNGVNIERY